MAMSWGWGFIIRPSLLLICFLSLARWLSLTRTLSLFINASKKKRLHDIDLSVSTELVLDFRYHSSFLFIHWHGVIQPSKERFDLEPFMDLDRSSLWGALKVLRLLRTSTAEAKNLLQSNVPLKNLWRVILFFLKNVLLFII